MLVNIFTGVLIGLGILFLKGENDHEGKHEKSDDSGRSDNPDTKLLSVEKPDRPRPKLTSREKTERLKLKTARLIYMTERLKKKGKTKNEPIIEKQPDAVGGVTSDSPGNEPHRNNGKTAVKEG